MKKFTLFGLVILLSCFFVNGASEYISVTYDNSDQVKNSNDETTHIPPAWIKDPDSWLKQSSDWSELKPKDLAKADKKLIEKATKDKAKQYFSSDLFKEGIIYDLLGENEKRLFQKMYPQLKLPEPGGAVDHLTFDYMGLDIEELEELIENPRLKFNLLDDGRVEAITQNAKATISPGAAAKVEMGADGTLKIYDIIAPRCSLCEPTLRETLSVRSGEVDVGESGKITLSPKGGQTVFEIPDLPEGKRGIYSKVTAPTSFGDCSGAGSCIIADQASKEFQVRLADNNDMMLNSDPTKWKTKLLNDEITDDSSLYMGRLGVKCPCRIEVDKNGIRGYDYSQHEARLITSDTVLSGNNIGYVDGSGSTHFQGFVGFSKMPKQETRIFSDNIKRVLSTRGITLNSPINRVFTNEENYKLVEQADGSEFIVNSRSDAIYDYDPDRQYKWYIVPISGSSRSSPLDPLFVPESVIMMMKQIEKR